MGGEATGSQSWQSEGYLYPSQLSGREHTAEGLGYFMMSANPCRVSSWWKHVRQRMRSVQGLCWLGRVAVIAMAKAGRESEWFPPPAIDPEVGPHAAKHLKVAHVSVPVAAPTPRYVPSWNQGFPAHRNLSQQTVSSSRFDLTRLRLKRRGRMERGQATNVPYPYRDTIFFPLVTVLSAL